MKRRPDWIVCVSNPDRRGYSACGEFLPCQFKLVDFDHADACIRAQSRLVPCKACMQKREEFGSPVLVLCDA